MAGTGYPSGWHDHVRANYKRTAGYVVAQSGDCLDIQDYEVRGPQTRVPGRAFKPMRPEDVVTLKLPKSWFMGVILCPGDTLQPLLGWITTLPRNDLERIVLYVHPAYDQESGARALGDAGLDSLRKSEFKGTWRAFHRLYGNDFSWQVWNDWA